MTYSVIIPARNEALTIADCVGSVLECGRFAPLVEVIVCDHGSTDGTAEAASCAGARVVEVAPSEVKTIAAVRNLGARLATGDVLVFLDADMLVPKDWLEKAHEHYQKGFNGLLGFVYKVPDTAGRIGKAWGNRLYDRRVRVVDASYLPSCNLFVPRELFGSLGGFDEHLATAEDKDLTLRALARGVRALSSPETHPVHLGYERDLAEFIRKEFWRQSDTLALLRRPGLFRRALRNPALSAFHLLAPLAAMLFFVLGHSWAGTFTLAVWPLPSAILAARLAGLFQPMFPLFYFLTFLRWTVSGVALCRQIFLALKKVFGQNK